MMQAHHLLLRAKRSNLPKKRPRILITCGPTREPIDPVRFLSNYSTGTFGLELAKLYLSKGYPVTLVHGPIAIPKNLKARKVPFETTRDLMKISHREIKRHDVIFMTAAVSDFRVKTMQKNKIKKGKNKISLSLIQNVDILKSLIPFKKGKIYVGFSVESERVSRLAYNKLLDKKLDLIVAQRVTEHDRPFGPKPIQALMVEKDGKPERFPRLSKAILATSLKFASTSFCADSLS